MMLTYLDATADAETVSSVLRSDGVVAVTGLVNPEIADTVAAELRPDLGVDEAPDPAWNNQRGVVGTVAHAKAQGGG